MKNEGAIQADPGSTGPSLRLIAASAAIVLAAYAATLQVANALPLFDALMAGAANAVATVLAGALAYRTIVLRLVGRRALVQWLGHLALGAAFAILTYWLLMVTVGLMHGVSFFEFEVRPFPSRASAWQMLQNASVYGIVAALAHLNARPEAMAVILSDPGRDDSDRSLSRYFIRSGDDIRPIDVTAILSIAGADDYAEVKTISGSHLVRMTLAEFEKALDPAKFIRVHRSRIVNVERIERAEPAGGGRLLLHMEDGEAITASRAGSRLVRERVI
jgi:two-component system LytT family response regulator